VKIFLRGAIVEVRLDVAPDHEVWRLIRSIVSRLNPKVQRESTGSADRDQPRT
jgi:hypothetical protein